MTMPYPALRFTGASILRDGEMQSRSIAIADGRITRGPLPEMDLSGYLVLPGIIDLHGDAFERHIAPRPSAPFPPQEGLRGADRDAAANGVTTAYLAQSWSWEGGKRSPDYALRMMQALRDYAPRALTKQNFLLLDWLQNGKINQEILSTGMIVPIWEEP